MARTTGIQIRRGAYSALPATGLLEGEPLFCTDTGNLFVATGATTYIAAVPYLAGLAAIGTPAVGDLLMMEDIDGAGVKAKKISFADFKTALNIPASDADEKVAVISGGTAGYLWGTTGADGVIRVSEGIQWTKDAGNAYVTLNFGFTSEARGDIALRGATVWDRLAIGAAGTFLKSDGTDAAWSNVIDGGTF